MGNRRLFVAKVTRGILCTAGFFGANTTFETGELFIRFSHSGNVWNNHTLSGGSSVQSGVGNQTTGIFSLELDTTGPDWQAQWSRNGTNLGNAYSLTGATKLALQGAGNLGFSMTPNNKPLGVDLNAFSLSSAEVPEPSNALVLGCLLLGVAGYRSRRFTPDRREVADS